MTIRSESRLERVLHAGTFAVTAEVVPPRGGGAGPVVGQAQALVGFADAVNVTDNPTASAHMSSLAGAAFVAQQGLEPIMQVTARDRNRLALSGDLLGGWALGVRGVLCLTGDPVAVGDHPEAREVNDLSVVELVRLVVALRDTGTLLSGQPVDMPPRYFVGVADVPLAADYDPARLEEKADAGADFVQTQIAYDVDALGAWAEEVRARGIFERMFVLVGVAPPRSAATARYVRDHLPGVVVPDAVISRLEESGESAQEEGVRLTVEIIDGLRAIPGIAGVHVMGLGHEEAVQRVVEAAGLLPRTDPPSAAEIAAMEAQRAAQAAARQEAARREAEEAARREAEKAARPEAEVRAGTTEVSEAGRLAPTRMHAQPEEIPPQPQFHPPQAAGPTEVRRQGPAREEGAPATITGPLQEAAPALPGEAEEPASPEEPAAAEAGVEATAEARPADQQEATPAGWAPTHVVPGEGLQAWQAPDPSAPQTARLAPGLPVQVVERLGAWARVVASNGWWGWVDGRLLP